MKACLNEEQPDEVALEAGLQILLTSDLRDETEIHSSIGIAAAWRKRCYYRIPMQQNG